MTPLIPVSFRRAFTFSGRTSTLHESAQTSATHSPTRSSLSSNQSTANLSHPGTETPITTYSSSTTSILSSNFGHSALSPSDLASSENSLKAGDLKTERTEVTGLRRLFSRKPSTTETNPSSIDLANQKHAFSFQCLKRFIRTRKKAVGASLTAQPSPSMVTTESTSSLPHQKPTSERNRLKKRRPQSIVAPPLDPVASSPKRENTDPTISNSIKVNKPRLTINTKSDSLRRLALERSASQFSTPTKSTTPEKLLNTQLSPKSATFTASQTSLPTVPETNVVPVQRSASEKLPLKRTFSSILQARRANTDPKQLSMQPNSAGSISKSPLGFFLSRFPSVKESPKNDSPSKEGFEVVGRRKKPESKSETPTIQEETPILAPEPKPLYSHYATRSYRKPPSPVISVSKGFSLKPRPEPKEIPNLCGDISLTGLGFDPTRIVISDSFYDVQVRALMHDDWDPTGGRFEPIHHHELTDKKIGAGFSSACDPDRPEQTSTDYHKNREEIFQRISHFIPTDLKSLKTEQPFAAQLKTPLNPIPQAENFIRRLFDYDKSSYNQSGESTQPHEPSFGPFIKGASQFDYSSKFWQPTTLKQLWVVNPD